MTNFIFSDWANNAAYIINVSTELVVDTVIIHEDGLVSTYTGKPLSFYGLTY
jgi:hypothetical protein